MEKNENGAVVSVAPSFLCRAIARHVLQTAMMAGQTHRLAPVYGFDCTRIASPVKRRAFGRFTTAANAKARH
jgi:hypothetical protein